MSPDVATARKALEDAIVEHAQAIIDIKGRLNTMTPIARLPPELLSEVFAHVARDEYEDNLRFYQTYIFSSRFYSWISVTHVCRSWRTIALNTPRLWGHIMLTRRDVVTNVLARSKKAPLIVCASIMANGDDRMKLLEEVVQETSRLQELRLVGQARLIQDFCPKIVGAANLLETMVLSDNTPPSYRTTIGDSSLPPALFDGHFPRLRNLEIRRLVFSWKIPVFASSITRLVLVGRQDSQSLLGTFDQLLSAVETMPSIEVLDLEDAVPRLPDEVRTLAAPERTIALPRLRRLSLNGRGLDCANLINHLSFPSDTRLAIVGLGSQGSDEVIRVVGEHVACSEPLLALRLIRTFGAQLHAKAWRSVTDLTSDPCVELRVDANPGSSTPSHLVRGAKMFTQVRLLDVNSEYQEWPWKSVFAGMPNLRVLSVTGDLHDDFIAAISAIRKVKKNRPASLVLPRLRVLKLAHTRMCTPEYDKTPEFLDELEDWLLLRCNYNLPIDELHLTNCVNLTEEDVERLVEIVPYVEWDKVVQFESEDEEDEDEEEEDYPYAEDWEDYDYDFDYYGVDDYDDYWPFF